MEMQQWIEEKMKSEGEFITVLLFSLYLNLHCFQLGTAKSSSSSASLTSLKPTQTSSREKSRSQSSVWRKESSMRCKWWASFLLSWQFPHCTILANQSRRASIGRFKRSQAHSRRNTQNAASTKLRWRKRLDENQKIHRRLHRRPRASNCFREAASEMWRSQICSKNTGDNLSRRRRGRSWPDAEGLCNCGTAVPNGKEMHRKWTVQVSQRRSRVHGEEPILCRRLWVPRAGRRFVILLLVEVSRKPQIFNHVNLIFILF